MGARQQTYDDRPAAGAVHHQASSAERMFPVDDGTYDLLQALVSKLEAIDAYRRYAQDGQAALFDDLLTDERRHADILLDAIRRRLETGTR